MYNSWEWKAHQKEGRVEKTMVSLLDGILGSDWNWCFQRIKTNPNPGKCILVWAPTKADPRLRVVPLRRDGRDGREHSAEVRAASRLRVGGLLLWHQLPRASGSSMHHPSSLQGWRHLRQRCKKQVLEPSLGKTQGTWAGTNRVCYSMLES